MLFPSIELRTKSRSPHVCSPFAFHSFSNSLWIVSPVPGTVFGTGDPMGTEAGKNHHCFLFLFSNLFSDVPHVPKCPLWIPHVRL